jgi:hypothetical protein
MGLVTRKHQSSTAKLSSHRPFTTVARLSRRVRLDRWCDKDDREWTDNLEFLELPLSETEKIVLVEAGPGCARGAQGANGAMWLIRFQGDEFSFLATPQQQFNGWLHSIQQTTSHGFRDLVLG